MKSLPIRPRTVHPSRRRQAIAARRAGEAAIELALSLRDPQHPAGTLDEALDQLLPRPFLVLADYRRALHHDLVGVPDIALERELRQLGAAVRHAGERAPAWAHERVRILAAAAAERRR